MFTATTTTARQQPHTAPARRFNLLDWLVRWNAAYRERQQIARLDSAALRDMGLSRGCAEKITVAEILARGTR